MYLLVWSGCGGEEVGAGRNRAISPGTGGTTHLRGLFCFFFLAAGGLKVFLKRNLSEI